MWSVARKGGAEFVAKAIVSEVDAAPRAPGEVVSSDGMDEREAGRYDPAS